MGQRYQARARVRATDSCHGTWSDWSHTPSWESKVGETPTPSPPPSGFQLIWFSEVSGVLVGVVVMIILALTWLCSTHRTTRLYIVKKLMGPPLPNPSKFFPDLNSAQGEDFKTWLSPKFARESYLDAFLLPVHISPLEVTHTVDTVSPRRPQPDTASPEDKKKKKKTMACDLRSCSSFSNQSYSLNLHLALPTSGGTLEPCAADSPYGPLVGNREEERQGDAVEESDEEEEDRGEERKPSRGLGNVEDTESSGEGGEGETEGETEEGGVEEERDGEIRRDREEERLMGLLFGGTSVITGGNSLQMSPSYECVERLQDQRWHLKSPDSGVGSWGEDQESRESTGDPDGPAFADAGRGSHFGSNVFQFPSCSSPLPTPLPCFTQIPLTLPGLEMEPGPFTLCPMDLPGKILEDLALMPSSGTIAPSSGGYMAV
ncbi:interleukin-2 receptor subunit beta [Hypomesus transpacificus]|uniref:interleukin-2 receptor subunit beta n=1 Tax=Hypomesus transpacificus TaxID=137520 RepID=UPI001F07DA12|nr:interleukin-2 receptor subunit beta [Hypomesus transpacificus]